MSRIRLHDKYFKPYIGKQQIEEGVLRLTEEIRTSMHDKNPLFIVVLSGAFIFASDLLRQYNDPCEVSFVRLRSNDGTQSTGKVKEVIGLDDNLSGRHLIIVEDIVDSGKTYEMLHKTLVLQKPASIKMAALFMKPDVYKSSLKVHFNAFKIDDRFIVGYGMDYNDQGRYLDSVFVLADSE